MIVEKLVVGNLQENCYLVGDKDELIVIDPGDEAERILKRIDEKGYKVKYIVLTHCHFDHIGAVCDIKEKTKAKLLISEREKDNYLNQGVNLSGFSGMPVSITDPDELLFEGDKVKSGEFEFEVINTPGHTSGGICLLCGKHLFTGDTLFNMSIGRTDFPTGNMTELLSSVKTKLFTLPKETIVYAGHGDNSTIGYEIENNMFF
ncbi:MAG: MBL fold metallo-hydrolase [Clostridia bacterium]|nr:MBL fold metallo-hydrolase [Clostridia bacterium]